MVLGVICSRVVEPSLLVLVQCTRSTVGVHAPVAEGTVPNPVPVGFILSGLALIKKAR